MLFDITRAWYRLSKKREAWMEGEDKKVTLIDGHHLTRALTHLIGSAEGGSETESALVTARLKDNLGKMKLWPGDLLLC